MVSMVRNREIFGCNNVGNLAFAAGYAAALGASLYWSTATPAGSYAAWRELPATLIPLAALSYRCTWEISAKAVGDAGLWQQGPAPLRPACFWGCATFATMLPLLMLHGLGWPKRWLLQWPAQAAYVALVLWRAPRICDSALLQHPKSQRQIGGLHWALRVLGMGLQVPSASRTDVPPPVQCRAQVSVAVFLLGFVLPVLSSSVSEYREFRQFAGARRPLPGWQVEAQRGALEQGCRHCMLSVMLVSLALNVWDVAIKLYSQGM